MRVVWGGSTAILFTGHEQKHSGGPCCAQPTIMVFWTAQEGFVNAGWNGLTHSTTRR
jgi:hypothetical protein